MPNTSYPENPKRLINLGDLWFYGIGLFVAVLLGVLNVLPGQTFNFVTFGYAIGFFVLYRIIFDKAPYLPFAVMGIWSCWASFLAFKIPDYQMAAALAMASFSFSGIIAGYYLTKWLNKREKSVGLSGRKSEIGNALFLDWLIAWLFNGAALVMLIFLLGLGQQGSLGLRVTLRVLIVFGAGLFCTLRALWKLWRLAHFGVAALDVTGHVEVGGTLNASILLNKQLSGAKEAFLTLHCERQRDEKKQRTSETLWEKQQPVLLSGSVTGIPTRIPVNFELPAELPASHGDDGTSEAIYWILDVRVPIPGPDYRDRFYVKVRRIKNKD